MDEIITLDYGSGGKKTARLIEQLLVPAFSNPALEALGDGALVEGAGRLAFSTDSFVVDPLFFPGGDIGKLSVCGTVNDLAVCGAEPKYLSLSFILEEGLKMEELRQIVASIQAQAEKAGVQIVTGDTKVVEKGRGDKIYINTAGIGFVRFPGLSPKNLRPGDAVIVSGTVGDHGTAVMLARSGMMQGDIRSDCAALNALCARVLGTGAAVRVLRDPTRGGVATTLNEFVEGTELGIVLREEDVPVRPQVRHARARAALLRQRGQGPRRRRGGGRADRARRHARYRRGPGRRRHRHGQRRLPRQARHGDGLRGQADPAEAHGRAAPAHLLNGQNRSAASFC